MIGIFDSGAGGLTVLRAIRNRISSFDIVYFGDTKHAPYGVRNRAELSKLTVEGFKFLKEKGARSIVSACNSVSASLALSILDTFSLASDHLIEMVGPTIMRFKDTNARIALCATSATIDSEIYQTGFQMIGKEIRTIPIPDLAGAIERGAEKEEIERIIADAFENVPRDFDILVLACTHYPLVIDSFRTVLGADIHLFDPAEAVAQRVEELYWPREVGNGMITFFISKESAPFRALVAKLFPNDAYSIEVIK